MTEAGPVANSPEATGRRAINPLDLSLERGPSRTTLTYQGETLLTPDGYPICDDTARVLEVVLDDLQTGRRLLLEGLRLQPPSHLTCYEIHCRRDRDGKQDGKTRGSCETDQDSGIGGLLWESRLPDELRSIMDLFGVHGHSESIQGETPSGVMGRMWAELDAAQSAVARVLMHRHATAVPIALAFALGGIDAKKYASAVWRFRERTDEVFRGCDAAGQFEYFEQIRLDAWKAERYMKAHVDQLKALVMRGEGSRLEFKTTLRKNLKTGRIDKDIVNANLKSIAGFLNSSGGTLVIGVTDEGEAVDNLLTLDELQSEDKFLRHLFSKMRDFLGGSVASEIAARFEVLNGASVCVVRCSKSPLPVFLRLKEVEAFFVRSGPSTESLVISEAVRYIRQQFPDYGG